MNVTLLNGFYMATDRTIGGWSTIYGSPSQEQITNANIIRSFFLNESWTLNAICGMLGCMQGESTINPAFIQEGRRWRLPNNGADLSDVPNSVMQNYYKEYYSDSYKMYGIGLVQWDGYSQRNNLDRQKLVAYAEDNNIIWYDGWTQLYRIRGEQIYDVDHSTTSFFSPVTINGIRYTFVNYPYSTEAPEKLAEAWTYGYEVNQGGLGERGNNAIWWYNFFTDPNAPAIINPQDFLLPLPGDPYQPPFDPDNPVEPEQTGADQLPIWLIYLLRKRRNKNWLVI